MLQTFWKFLTRFRKPMTVWDLGDDVIDDLIQELQLQW